MQVMKTPRIFQVILARGKCKEHPVVNGWECSTVFKGSGSLRKVEGLERICCISRDTCRLQSVVWGSRCATCVQRWTLQISAVSSVEAIKKAAFLCPRRQGHQFWKEQGGAFCCQNNDHLLEIQPAAFDSHENACVPRVPCVKRVVLFWCREHRERVGAG